MLEKTHNTSNTRIFAKLCSILQNSIPMDDLEIKTKFA